MAMELVTDPVLLLADGKDTVDVESLSAHVNAELPPYARPVFLRLQQDIAGQGFLSHGFSLADGVSGVLTVEDTAATLTVRPAGGEELRFPLRLRAGEVTEVRDDEGGGGSVSDGEEGNEISIEIDSLSLRLTES